MLANATLQQNFLDDFGALGNDELHAMMDMMAKNNGAAVDNWINLRALNINPEYKNAEVLADNALSSRYVNYYSVPNLKTELQKFDGISRLEFMKSTVSQVTPLPDKGYLSMWLKVKMQGNLANYQTEEILRKFENFDDALLDKAVYEMAHTGQRGKDVRTPINQNADDIITQFKPILEDPNRVWASKEMLSPSWERWRKSYFYKFITNVGRKFEEFVNVRFAIRNSSEYNALQNWMISNGIGKNLDDYDLFTSVQLKYNAIGNYFVADQVFVQYIKVGKFKKIDDIIVIETKLKQTTATSANQKAAINAAYDGNFSGFEMRNNTRKSKYYDYVVADESHGNFKFNGQPTIIKAYDLDNGEEISGFKRLTNLDNN
ncbi:hypothetical protein P0M11_11180 [Kaistella sp. PBT33-4]|uniref:hypothetical protein n=1 Tax=Kaistella sp. PBT33-4 TaxID=3032000 RepID=UPI0023D88F11|nr:hypothetical protein [Kaistella sp. PBT33-4]MDF0720560.1 hypothetical protein [Kaistella sp. PBT33-4]